MITSKQDLKKYINRVGCEVAQAVLPAAVCSHIITDQQADELITKLSELKAEAHARLNIAFDKTQKDFENIKNYAKARRQYFKIAYAKAREEYEKGVEEVIEKVNKAAAANK